MNGKVYSIWLSLALGAGARCSEILGAFDSAREIYDSDMQTLRISGVFTQRQLEKIEKTKLQDAQVQIETCEKNGWQCVTYGEDGYPKLLERIADPPLVLYVNGGFDYVNDALFFGIVGTRNPSDDSVRTAMSISAQLADAGAVIVSGGALGIDSAAHQGALKAGGKTVAVLGCGLGTRYLMQGAHLREEISRSGAVISEFSPFTPASRTTFPIRNRIISGISRGVLVVEAGEKSGSIITANCAMLQGRDVFAVPGNIVTSSYVGANRLIRDGATAVTCAQDIIDEYDSLYPGKLKRQNYGSAGKKQEGSKTAKVVKKSTALLNEKEKAVYEKFGSEPLYPGDVAAMTGISLGEVNVILTSLEINDYIISVSGGRFTLI